MPDIELFSLRSTTASSPRRQRSARSAVSAPRLRSATPSITRPACACATFLSPSTRSLHEERAPGRPPPSFLRPSRPARLKNRAIRGGGDQPWVVSSIGRNMRGWRAQTYTRGPRAESCRAKNQCPPRLRSFLHDRALRFGGAHSLVDHTLAVSAGVFGLEWTRVVGSY